MLFAGYRFGYSLSVPILENSALHESLSLIARASVRTSISLVSRVAYDMTMAVESAPNYAFSKARSVGPRAELNTLTLLYNLTIHLRTCASSCATASDLPARTVTDDRSR